MLRKRILVLLLVVALVLPLGASLAQDGGEVFCGDLAAADCDILVQSAAAMAGVTAVAFNVDMGLDMAAGPESFSFGLVGDGAFAVDPEGLAALEAMAGEAETLDPEALGEMMTQGLQAFGTMIGSISGELNVEVSMEGDTPGSIPLHLVLVDGVAYLDLAALMPAGAGAEGTPQWMGIDLGALFAGISEMPGMNMEDMLGQMGGLGDMTSLFESEFFQQMSDPAFANQFLSITRLADAEVAGQAVAVFETTFDLGAMMSSEAFAGYMQAVMQMQMQAMGEEAAAAMEGMDPETLGQAMAAMFQDASMRMEQSIGLTDFYSYRNTFAMDMTMDLAALAAAMPEGTDMTGAPQSMTLGMNLTLDLSNFNVPLAVTAPEGAQVIDPMMFLGAGMPSGA